MPSENLFALDIGTRKVAGVIASLDEGGRLVVHAASVAEHPTRCMLDGQVHDVRLVANTVRRVYEELRSQGFGDLRRAAVAAAGRALACEPGTAEAVRDRRVPVTEAERQTLVLSAVSKARDQVASRKEGALHCVGYAVTGLRLDGETYLNPVGQRGEKFEAQVLATFLPARVLEGLLAVLAEVGLECHSMNLEPIAAMSLSLPPDARRLNVALVDIGAGTSDIAVVRSGSVSSFAMVPVAGDEITEKLCETLFIDFGEGERVKRAAGGEASISATSLIGRELQLDPSRIRQAMFPAVTDLTGKVGAEILRLNGGPPAGVVLVGGSSAVADLPEALAETLGLPADRVGSRPVRLLPWVVDRTHRMGDAAAVTSLGIAWCGLRGEVLNSRKVTLNNETLALLQTGPRTTVGDALLAGNFPAGRMWGRPGLALTVTVDGALRMIPGEPGSPLVVRRNGAETALDEAVASGDVLEAAPAKDGADAIATIGSFLGELGSRNVRVNGQAVPLRRPVTVNGEEAGPHFRIPDRAEIRLGAEPTVGQAVDAYLSLPGGAGEQMRLAGKLKEREVLVSVNGEPRFLRQRNFSLQRDGQEIALDAPVCEGDELQLVVQESHVRVRDLVPLPTSGKDLRFVFAEEPKTLPGTPGKILMNGREVDPEEFVVDGAEIQVVPGRDASATLADVLPTGEPGGSRVRVFVNGLEVGLGERIPEGARIDIVTAPEAG